MNVKGGWAIKRISAAAFLLAVIFLMSLVMASFDLKNHSVQRNYAAGDTIKGNLNISFKGELAQSTLTSNFNGSVKLADFLKNNSLVEGADYNCSVKKCVSGYTAQSAVNSVSFNAGEKKSIGFKIAGDNVEIKSLKIPITSNINDSCFRQIDIDVLEKDENYITNYNYKNTSCGFVFAGCFDSSLNQGDYQNVEIGSTESNNQYCEKLTLPTAPAYQLGAKVKNSTQGYANLKMKLYGSDWTYLGECALPKHTQETEELKCVVNYTGVRSKDYYACVSVQHGANANYQIRVEQSGQTCGGKGTNFGNASGDYEIFAESMRFDSLDIVINESSFFKLNGNGLTSYIDSYITNNYGRSCAGSGCVIQFQVYADFAQTLTFSNPEVKFNSNLGLVTNNQLYTLEKSEPLLDSKQLNLDLSKAGFTIPLGSSDRTLQLYLNGGPIFSSPLAINLTESFSFDVNPKVALIGIDTTFSAITGSNITSSSWKFGDGGIGTSAGKSITHRYLEEKTYKMEVELTRSDGIKSTRTFDVFAGNASESARILSEKYETRIKNISKQIQNYPTWISAEIQKKLNLTSLNASFNNIKGRLAIASSNENYTEVLNALLALNVPYSVSSSKTGSGPLAAGFDNIDTGYIAAISKVSGLTESKKENLKYEIINWSDENYNAEARYEIISRYGDSGIEPAFTYFKINLTPKSNNATQAHFIINYPKDAVVFAKDYGQKQASYDENQGVEIPVSGKKEIEFILPEMVEIDELGAYISPDLSEFALSSEGGVAKNERPQKAFWYYILVAIGIFVLYIALQEWYKRYYESYLFKNRDDFYNIINFIYNARISQLSDGEIRKKLGGIGWKGEQITYAFRKLDGKRTGMFEIPIFRFFEQRKIRAEIEKRRHNRMGDARFIKRPEL